MKNKRIKTLFTLTFMFLSMGALAGQRPVNLDQGRTPDVLPEKQQSDQVPDHKIMITGRVVDVKGEPIIGATIKMEGSSQGTVTDLDGKFSISTLNNSVLDISYIGYNSQTIKVGGQRNLLVVLKENSQNLNEVVVIGYGTLKKKDLTGSVGTVMGEDLAARKTTQLSTALEGAASGIMATRSNSSPGTTANIKIRGITTINNSSPLFIVDGVEEDINQVNPNDVENISVLKDAASASIYGSRAAGGVILITTKRAQEGKVRLNYDFSYGSEIPTTQPQYVGIQRYLEMTNELRYNDNPAGGMYQAYSQDQVDNWIKNNLTDPDNYPITNWKKLILKSSAPDQTHSVSISGGSNNIRTRFSFRYDKEDGLYGDVNFYKRFMVRINNDFHINKYLSATTDVSFKSSQNKQPNYSPFYDIRIASPVYAAIWKDGLIAEGKSGMNPYGRVKQGGTNDTRYYTVYGKASLEVTPFSGLKISAIVSPDYNFSKSKNFQKAIPYTIATDPNTIGGYLEGHSITNLYEGRDDNRGITFQVVANYAKLFGKHDLNLMGGYENRYSFWEYLSASRNQYQLDSYPYLNDGPAGFQYNSGYAEKETYRSWFGRLVYNYDNRYLFQANIRADGSSHFAKDNRWGEFPSFSAGWIASEENFMKKLDLKALSYLKFRASYGNLGNDRIGLYPYQAALNFSNVLLYQNGNATPVTSAAQWNYAIHNISWEKTVSYDLGLDVSFFRNRLNFTGDFYKKKTEDMLLAIQIPEYMGFGNPNQNTGNMYTHGYDLSLGWTDKVGEVYYDISVNLSDFKSKMGNLGGTQFIGDQVTEEGSYYSEWYGYKSDGLFLTQNEVNNSPKINANVRVGDIKYKDISGPDGVPDGKISPEYDRIFLGNSLPRYLFGGKMDVRYKGWDFSVTFQGVGSRLVRKDVMMAQPLKDNWGNIPAIIDDKYWSSLKSDQQNARAKYPELTYANVNVDYCMSDFWLFNGRYLRLKNLTVGYTIPQAITSKFLIHALRVYVSANDLFCLSKYPKGWDPEMGTSSYPITTSLLCGVSLSF